MAIVDEVSDRTSVMYDGLGGALSVPNRYHSFAALDLIARGQFETIAGHWLDSFGVRSEDALRRVIRREFLSAVSREAAVDRLARELESHSTVPDPIKSFNFWIGSVGSLRSRRSRCCETCRPSSSRTSIMTSTTS